MFMMAFGWQVFVYWTVTWLTCGLFSLFPSRCDLLWLLVTQSTTAANAKLKKQAKQSPLLYMQKTKQPLFILLTELLCSCCFDDVLGCFLGVLHEMGFVLSGCMGRIVTLGGSMGHKFIQQFYWKLGSGGRQRVAHYKGTCVQPKSLWLTNPHQALHQTSNSL